MGIAKVRVLCLPFFAHLQNLVRPSYSTFFFSFIAFRSSPFLSLYLFFTWSFSVLLFALCTFLYLEHYPFVTRFFDLFLQ